MLLTQGVPIPLALLTACLFGAPVGAVMALIHTRLGVNDLFAAILTTTGLYTITLRLMGGSNIPISDTNPVVNWPDLGPGPDGRCPVALTVVVLGQIGLPALMVTHSVEQALNCRWSTTRRRMKCVAVSSRLSPRLGSTKARRSTSLERRRRRAAQRHLGDEAVRW